MKFHILKHKRKFQNKMEYYLINNDIPFKSLEFVEFPTGIKTIQYDISRRQFADHIAKLPHDRFFEIFKLIISNADDPDQIL